MAAFQLVALLVPALAVAAPGEGVAGGACISRVLAADAGLGAVRDRAPESGPVAEAVIAYADALSQLDFDGCPPDFTDAFQRHIAAWRAAVPLLQGFGDERGEMHALFERIRSQRGGRALAGHEARIWATWSEVEAAAR